MSDTVANTTPAPRETGPGHDDPNRRDFIHIAAAAAAVGGVAAVAWPLVDQMNPSADTLALASIEFDLDKVELGQQVTIKWRGKPVFVRKRTPAEIAAAEAVNVSSLRDPQTDAERHKPGKAEWLIVVGVCTHLGCVPNFRSSLEQGIYEGWFCPCHGSVYDTSGRIRKGPAPLNLLVPDYDFLSDTRVKIG